MDGRHNDPQTPHERARLLASDRLHEPLGVSEDAWLETHLAECDECRATAAGFEADRELLRSLPAPEPPRDLWARTAVALDRERGRRNAVGRPGFRVRWPALVGVLAVLVVGVIVGRSIMPSGGSPGVGLSSPGVPSSSRPTSTPVAGATPLAVPPGVVAWAMPGADGSYVVNVANVAAVCPEDAAPAADCAPLDAGAKQVVALDSKPGSIVLAPQSGQAAVVDSSASTTGGSIIVIPIARATPPPTVAPPSPSASPSASASPTASPSPSPSAVASSTPAETPSPSVKPTEVASPTATAEPSPSATPTASPSAEPTPTPTPVPTPTPTVTPAPTLAASLAIIDDVIVVGGDASYSADGEWLAFSARPADGSHGPDVYVWRLGDPTARALTTDHDSVFSDWADDLVLASRPLPGPQSDGGAPTPAMADPVSVLLDPATGKQHGSTLVGIWRPVVDPSGRWAVYWTGSLVADKTARTFVPDQGRLVIGDWAAIVDGSQNATPEPRRLLGGSSDAPIRAWEVRWDPSGRYVGVWVADPLATDLGRLSLMAIDRSTGAVDDGRKPLLRDTSALPGFSIGDGRIAWATPPGQDGEGSRLLVLAWKGPDAGRIQSDPAPAQGDIVVVR